MASDSYRRASRFLLYGVRGQSMTPSLRPGDYLLVRTAATSLRPPARRDIVVVNTPERDGAELLKRIVGLPGERIAFTDGTLLVDGERLTERYLRGLPPYAGLDDSEFTMGDDEYFVMGDNRAHSTDSRHYGAVRLSQIEGRAICRIWPPQRWWKL